MWPQNSLRVAKKPVVFLSKDENCSPPGTCVRSPGQILSSVWDLAELTLVGAAVSPRLVCAVPPVRGRVAEDSGAAR